MKIVSPNPQELVSLFHDIAVSDCCLLQANRIYEIVIEVPFQSDYKNWNLYRELINDLLFNAYPLRAYYNKKWLDQHFLFCYFAILLGRNLVDGEPVVRYCFLAFAHCELTDCFTQELIRRVQNLQEVKMVSLMHVGNNVLSTDILSDVEIWNPVSDLTINGVEDYTLREFSSHIGLHKLHYISCTPTLPAPEFFS